MSIWVPMFHVERWRICIVLKTAGDFTICLGKVVKFDRFRESLSELRCDCIVDPIS